MLTLRETKGSPLTHQEMDSNFQSVFGIHNLFYVEDRKPSGTNGGTFASGAWRTRDLNTIIINNISGSSLSNNHIMLPSGNYWCEISPLAQSVNNHQSRLYNTTNNNIILMGMSVGSGSSIINSQMVSSINGFFILQSNSTIILQHRCRSTRDDYGFGQAANFGLYELYSQIKIWKIGE